MIRRLLEVDSRNVKAIGYDPVERYLVVEFHAGRTRYRFDGVSADDFARLANAESVGVEFERTLKHWPARRILKLGEKL